MCSGPWRALYDATISKLLRELGISAVPHGVRWSFRDWCRECSNAPREVGEAPWRTRVEDKAEAAYARSGRFGRRKKHGLGSRLAGSSG